MKVTIIISWLVILLCVGCASVKMTSQCIERPENPYKNVILIIPSDDKDTTGFVDIIEDRIYNTIQSKVDTTGTCIWLLTDLDSEWRSKPEEDIPSIVDQFPIDFDAGLVVRPCEYEKKGGFRVIHRRYWWGPRFKYSDRKSLNYALDSPPQSRGWGMRDYNISFVVEVFSIDTGEIVWTADSKPYKGVDIKAAISSFTKKMCDKLICDEIIASGE